MFVSMMMYVCEYDDDDDVDVQTSIFLLVYSSIYYLCYTNYDLFILIICFIPLYKLS